MLRAKAIAVLRPGPRPALPPPGSAWLYPCPGGVGRLEPQPPITSLTRAYHRTTACVRGERWGLEQLRLNPVLGGDFSTPSCSRRLGIVSRMEGPRVLEVQLPVKVVEVGNGAIDDPADLPKIVWSAGGGQVLLGMQRGWVWSVTVAMSNFTSRLHGVRGKKRSGPGHSLHRHCQPPESVAFRSRQSPSVPVCGASCRHSSNYDTTRCGVALKAIGQKPRGLQCRDSPGLWTHSSMSFCPEPPTGCGTAVVARCPCSTLTLTSHRDFDRGARFANAMRNEDALKKCF